MHPAYFAISMLSMLLAVATALATALGLVAGLVGAVLAIDLMVLAFLASIACDRAEIAAGCQTRGRYTRR